MIGLLKRKDKTKIHKNLENYVTLTMGHNQFYTPVFIVQHLNVYTFLE